MSHFSPVSLLFLLCVLLQNSLPFFVVPSYADTGKILETSYDLNGDGITDLWKSQHEGAKFAFKVTVDKNQDGFEETRLLYDEKNGMLQEQIQDTTQDRQINQWAYFKKNQPQPFLIQSDTTQDGKVDSWGFYDASGRLIRHGVDHNANQQMDQIFFYTSSSSHFPVRMEQDRNEDGKMDYKEWYDTKGKVTKTLEIQ